MKQRRPVCSAATSVELPPPFHGLAQEFGHPGCPALSGRLGPPPAPQGAGHNGVARHPAGQEAPIARWERHVRTEGDFDDLLVERAGWGAVGERNVDDPEDDLRLGPPCAGSNTGTIGELQTRLRKAATDESRPSPARQPSRGSRFIARIPEHLWRSALSAEAAENAGRSRRRPEGSAPVRSGPRSL
jgi:hypothetical protein